METLVIALWRAPDTNAATCRAALLDEWVSQALYGEGVLAVELKTQLPDQGPHTHVPDERGDVPNADALITLGLERAHDLDDVPARDLLHKLARRIEVWRVQTHQRRVCVATLESAPRVVMVSFVQRLHDLSHEQFVRHWTERHTQLALRHHVGLCGYRQHVVRRAYTPGGHVIDGIAELEFATRDDFEQRFYDSDDGKQIIRADIARFIEPVPVRLTTLMGTAILRSET